MKFSFLEWIWNEFGMCGEKARKRLIRLKFMRQFLIESLGISQCFLSRFRSRDRSATNGVPPHSWFYVPIFFLTFWLIGGTETIAGAWSQYINCKLILDWRIIDLSVNKCVEVSSRLYHFATINLQKGSERQGKNVSQLDRSFDQSVGWIIERVCKLFSVRFKLDVKSGNSVK